MDILKKYSKQIIAVFALIYILIEAGTKNDFDIFYQASQDLFNGINIYDKLYAQWYHYLYSLWFGILIHPLTFFPLYLAKVIWLSLNLFFLYRIFTLAYKKGIEFNLEQNKLKWALALTFIFCLRFIRDNFHLAQLTIFILYSLIEGLNFIWKKENLKGSFLLALGINFKLLPLVIIPYLFWKGYFRAFGLTLFLTGIFFLSPCLITGMENYLSFMKSWLQLINPLQTKHIIDTEERSFHSLTTLLPTLLMEKVPDQFALQIKRNIFDLSLNTVNVIIAVVRLFFISLTLFFIGSKPFQKTESIRKKWMELSYLCLIIPLIFPHQQHYAFLLCLPAIFISIIFQFTQKSKLKILLLFIIYLCFNLTLLLGEFNIYYEHYKIITYGALLLVIILVHEKSNYKSYSRITSK